MTTNPPALALSDLKRIEELNATVPGWSGPVQYAFFKSVLAVRPHLRDLLMLGVCHGRDFAYILDILARYHAGREFRLVGVDKFADTPCADWPKDKASKTWKEAGFGEAPDIEKTRAHLDPLHRPTHPAVTLELLQMDAEAYLSLAVPAFDLVYLDTSHDYDTVKRQLELVARACRPRALVCGDDYSNAGTWGVKAAVKDKFTAHDVTSGWVWHAPIENLTP